MHTMPRKAKRFGPYPCGGRSLSVREARQNRSGLLSYRVVYVRFSFVESTRIYAVVKICGRASYLMPTDSWAALSLRL